MGDIAPPVPYGKRLVPTLIDEIARDDPRRVYGYLPRSSNLKDGFYDVTFEDFARGINRMAEYLEDKVGKSESFETLAYMGPHDLRYFAVVVAGCKIGYKTLLPSPRNSLEGQLNLLTTTECKVILTSKAYHLQPDLLSQSGLERIEVPELSEIIAKGPVREYRFGKSYDEAKNDPFLVLHTSGSTGLPKPVVLQHGWTSAIDSNNELPLYNGYGSILADIKNKRVFGSLPPFHAAGLAVSLLMPLVLNTSIVWGPVNRPINAALVDEILDTTHVDVLFAAPSVIEDMSQSEASLERISKLYSMAYGGGPLGRQAGDIVSKRTKIINFIGSTEISMPPLYSHDASTWEYFHYSPNLPGIEFRSQGDGTYEQVLVRDSATDRFHSAWWTFPDNKEYSMNDLYIKHPDKVGLWLYLGRADDVIVLSNGEKLNPTAMEAALREHKGVKGALIAGQARFAPSAIIELEESAAKSVKTQQQRAQFIDEIWSYAREANKAAPAHAQLAQDRIILSTDGKPFLRAGKGMVQRQGTIKAYAKEIDELYRRSDEDVVVDLEKINVDQDVSSLEKELGQLIANVVGVDTLEMEKDFFAIGMDSLHVMTVIKQLKSALVGIEVEKLDTRLVYTNPNVSGLSAALKSMVALNGTVPAASREQTMDATLHHYIPQLPKPSSGTKARKSDDQLTVILTGSTGSLGSYLLHTLISNPGVSKIYCLNRRANAEQKQEKDNASRGLVSQWDAARVEFLHADLSKPCLGLEQNVYERLRDEASVIIHNQWQVDFNLSLQSFEPHILGSLNIINLASGTPFMTPPPIFFTSSIGTVGNWSSSESVPEIALLDPIIPLPQGYSESKWIAERLIAEARERSGVSGAVLRIGQIAGPVEFGVKGVWNKGEWFPSLIASSKYLGVIPLSIGSQNDVSWTPVDIMSQIIVELVEADCSHELQAQPQVQPWTKYYHLTNPKSSNWSHLVPVVQGFFSKVDGKDDMKAVSLAEWVKTLEGSVKAENIDFECNPALKLLDFFRGLALGGEDARLETRETEIRSERMRDLGAVTGEWMTMWLEQWGF